MKHTKISNQQSQITNHKPRCSIVVRAFNEEKHIARLLDGIAQQTIKEIEVILVDSGSTDGTVSIATDYSAQFPIHIVHIRPDEFTFGRSLNLGIAQAQADLVVIASAHVYPVYPDWLKRLLAPFTDIGIALSYGMQRGDDTTKFSEQQIFARWYPAESEIHKDNPFCNNANAAIRRSLWEDHNYDETLSGLEDLAWANWAIERDYAVAYVAEAELIHVHDERPRAVYNRYRREAMAFKRLFPNEHFNARDLLRLVTTNIASDLWHATRQRVLLPNLGSIFWFRWMQLWGTYQGYRHAGPLTWQLRKTFYYPPSMKRSGETMARSVEPIRYNEEVESSESR